MRSNQQNAAGARPLRELITRRLGETGKTLQDLARALGYERPLVLKLYMMGSMKMPANRVRALAAALDIDEATVTRCWIAECLPELLPIVERLITTPPLTSEERRLIEKVRAHTSGTDASVVVVDGHDVLAIVMV